MKRYQVNGNRTRLPCHVTPEAGFALRLVRIDAGTAPLATEAGRERATVNPKDPVPALQSGGGFAPSEA